MVFSVPSAKFVKHFFDLCQKSRSIVITSHHHPDDDSISSVLSVYQILKSKYPQKKIKIIYSGSPVETYIYFNNFQKINFVADIATKVRQNDLLILLDGNNFTRFSKDPEYLKTIKNTICIDHHPPFTPDNFSLSLIAPVYLSTAEIIYHLFKSNTKIDRHLAETLMLGILGDTGNFSYLAKSSSKTLLVAKKLIEVGDINIQLFQSKYRPYPKNIFSLISLYIQNTRFITVPNWPPFIYTTLDRSHLDNNTYTLEEIHQASDIYLGAYARSVKGYGWGFVLHPEFMGNYYISLRSLPGSANVKDIVERQKIGGGHACAAGGIFKSAGKPVSPKAALAKILKWLRQNRPQPI